MMATNTRREFLADMGAGLAVAALGCAGLGKAGTETLNVNQGSPLQEVLGDDRLRILESAARAPSSHNSQPWLVRVRTPDDWTVEPDPARRLPAIDPTNREQTLSLGTFVEYLVTAATALGFDARIQEASSPGALSVKLVRAPTGPVGVEQLARIARRRTLRKAFSDAPLPPEDLAALSGAIGPGARWIPRDAPEARWIEEAAANSFHQQTWRDPAQQELAHWIRFSDREIREKGDGLTAEAMELGWVQRFFMRNFMDAESVTGKTFRNGGVETTQAQATQGAGWLVIGARDDGAPSLLDAGRGFARMALLLQERRLAAHPMSQVLEEKPWRTEVGSKTGVSWPQFLLRIGRVDAYPDPVSPRRPAVAFTSVV